MAAMKLCAVDGCGKPASCRGWCRAHYTRWQRNGDPNIKKTGGTIRGVCSIAECGEPHKSRGFCSTHYARWGKHGTAAAAWTTYGEPAAWLEAHISHSGQECLIWPFARSDDGRGVIRIDSASTKANRVMCEAVHGPPPTPKHEATHSCGLGHLGCINPTHLRWGTHTENMADKLVHGTHNRGERHPGARLTEADVRRIRALKGVARRAEIAQAFGIHPTTVGQIQRRKTWAWLT